MSRILILAKGSFGDVFPLFALASALQAQKHTVICAVPEKHRIQAAAYGFETLVPQITPSPRKPRGWLRRMLDIILSFDNASLSDEFSALEDAAKQADLLIGNQIAFITPLLAETFGKPWVYCAISPLAIYSKFDPPLFPGMHNLPLRGFEFPGKRAAEYQIARWVSRFWASAISRERSRLGLPQRGHPLFEGKFSPDLNLFLCSSTIITPQPDWPLRTYLTGFCWHAPDFPNNPEQGHELNRFLSSGPPPVLLLLGSDARTRPGHYYHIGIEACRRLNLRTIAVVDPRFHANLPQGEDVLVIGYRPYSELIRSARLVVHSAGIGTLGWCLRYGKFSILTPGAEDQFDNARRAEKRGFARVIPRGRYSVDKLTECLREYLTHPDSDAACRQAAENLSDEDGATRACTYVTALIGQNRKNR